MGWGYDNRIAYGICLNIWDNIKVRKLIFEKMDILDYSDEMSIYGEGTVFLYIKSTLKIRNSIYGIYKINNPKNFTTIYSSYPIIHQIITDKKIPCLTKEELKTIETISELSNLKLNPIWIEYAEMK